jgi:hypothetical protein
MFSPKFIVLFAAFVTVFLSFSAPAEAQNCPRRSTVMILKPIITKTKVFRSDARTMTEWSSGHTQNVGVVLGLGGGEIGTKFEAAFKYSTTPDGSVCVALDKVKATFYAYPRMYIAANYKKSSCEYDAIVTHEKRHIRALEDFFYENQERFQIHLGRIAKTIPLYGPVASQDVPGVKQELMNHVMGEYTQYYNQQVASLQREQRKIDSPNEYRGVEAKCDNW